MRKYVGGKEGAMQLRGGGDDDSSDSDCPIKHTPAPKSTATKPKRKESKTTAKKRKHRDFTRKKREMEAAKNKTKTDNNNNVVHATPLPMTPNSTKDTISVLLEQSNPIVNTPLANGTDYFPTAKTAAQLSPLFHDEFQSTTSSNDC